MSAPVITLGTLIDNTGSAAEGSTGNDATVNDATVNDATVNDAAQRHVAAVLNALTPAQLADLAAGRAELVFRPGPAAEPARRTRRPVVTESVRSEVATAVETINQLADRAEVDDYLRRHDARLTLPMLKAIARALGPTVPATGRSKAELRRDIVEGTVGFRTRSAAMSGGAWA
jgi:hypothetical protein